MSILRSALVILSLQAGLALADEPVVRIGGTLGYQRTDRNAWVFGPSLEVKLMPKLTIRGEGQLEFGDLDDPFGESNIFDGPGPHVNHILVGPAYRPSYQPLDLAVGAGVGLSITHSRFAPDKDFLFDPAAGFFAQAGKKLGPIELALQARLDLSPKTPQANVDQSDLNTIAGRLVLSIGVPIYAPAPKAVAAK
jgi:hypothetical protein